MLKSVNQPIRKKDAMALVTGKPVYMDDLGIFDHALIVKALRLLVIVISFSATSRQTTSPFFRLTLPRSIIRSSSIYSSAITPDQTSGRRISGSDHP